MIATSRKAREAVMERWPDAGMCWSSFRPARAWFYVYSSAAARYLSNGCPTRDLAWIDAAKRLEGEVKC